MHADSHHASPPSRFARLNDLTVDPSHVELLGRAGLDSLDALMRYGDGQPLSKPGLDPWRTRMRVTLRDGATEQVLYLKRFEHPPRRARGAARRAGASSLAGCEWRWIERLTVAGVPCLKGVAFGEQLSRGREVRSAILTAPVPGRSLETWCRTWTAADRATIRGLIPATAALVRKLHDAGFVHRDLYLSHLFFDPTAPIEGGLHLIDLARVMRPAWRMARWMVKDLAAMNHSSPAARVTRTDRVRWLRAYLGEPHLSATGKALAYRVIGKSASIARRDARKRR